MHLSMSSQNIIIIGDPLETYWRTTCLIGDPSKTYRRPIGERHAWSETRRRPIGDLSENEMPDRRPVEDHWRPIRERHAWSETRRRHIGDLYRRLIRDLSETNQRSTCLIKHPSETSIRFIGNPSETVMPHYQVLWLNWWWGGGGGIFPQLLLHL